MEILKFDEEHFNRAWEIFKNQKRSELSFTDCTNIAIMGDLGIRNIATFDGGFEGRRDKRCLGRLD